jgi:hypothetical protein
VLVLNDSICLTRVRSWASALINACLDRSGLAYQVGGVRCRLSSSTQTHWWLGMHPGGDRPLKLPGYEGP